MEIPQGCYIANWFLMGVSVIRCNEVFFSELTGLGKFIWGMKILINIKSMIYLNFILKLKTWNTLINDTPLSHPWAHGQDSRSSIPCRVSNGISRQSHPKQTVINFDHFMRRDIVQVGKWHFKKSFILNIYAFFEWPKHSRTHLISHTKKWFGSKSVHGM